MEPRWGQPQPLPAPQQVVMVADDAVEMLPSEQSLEIQRVECFDRQAGSDWTRIGEGTVMWQQQVRGLVLR